MRELDIIERLFLESRKVSTDSRKVEGGTLFFALKGEQFDGNKFAPDALKKGAVAAVVDNPQLIEEQIGKLDESYIVVEDSLVALQQLAKRVRENLNIPVVAITGSNGKTTTKELVTAALSSCYNVLSTKGNFNNHIGLPLTLLTLTDQVEVAVIEMGASAEGEIELLCSIAQPTIGIITNVGKAHLLGFNSIEGVKEAKGELYHWLQKSGGRALYNEEDSIIKELIEQFPKLEKHPYGVEKSGAKIIPPTRESPYLTLQLKEGEQIESKLIGSYNRENILAALEVAELLHCQRAKAIEAIEHYQPENLRSQLTEGGANSLIIDAYNANPTSMRAALSSFQELKGIKRGLILGDMLELGRNSIKEHIAILELVNELKVEKLYLVGEQFRLAAEEIEESSSERRRALIEQTTFAKNSDQLKELLKEQKPEGYLFLIKGSRGIALEKVVEQLL